MTKLQTTHIDSAEAKMYISESQIMEIRKKVDTIVTLKHARRRKKSKSLKETYGEVMDRFFLVFGVLSINELQELESKTVLDWLDRWIGSIPVKVAKIKLPKKQRAKLIIVPEVAELSKVIQKKAQKELKMNISKVLYFAYQKLGLPNMVSKLERLTEIQLKVLYGILFNEKYDQ